MTTDAPPDMARPIGSQGGGGGGGAGQGVMLGDNSWLASLAMGDASSSRRASRLALLAAPLALLTLHLPRL